MILKCFFHLNILSYMHLKILIYHLLSENYLTLFYLYYVIWIHCEYKGHTSFSPLKSKWLYFIITHLLKKDLFFTITFQKGLIPIAIINFNKILGQKAMNHHMDYRTTTTTKQSSIVNVDKWSSHK